MVADSIAETHAIESRSRSRFALSTGCTGVNQWKLDVLERARAWKKIEILENEPDERVANVRELATPESRNVATRQRVRAARRTIETSEHVHQRRLTRS
jgi:hypothetical protein